MGKKIKFSHKRLIARLFGIILLMAGFLVFILSLALGGFLMIIGFVVCLLLLIYGLILLVTGERSKVLEAYIDPFSHL